MLPHLARPSHTWMLCQFGRPVLTLIHAHCSGLARLPPSRRAADRPTQLSKPAARWLALDSLVLVRHPPQSPPMRPWLQAVFSPFAKKAGGCGQGRGDKHQPGLVGNKTHNAGNYRFQLMRHGLAACPSSRIPGSGDRSRSPRCSTVHPSPPTVGEPPAEVPAAVACTAAPGNPKLSSSATGSAAGAAPAAAGELALVSALGSSSTASLPWAGTPSEVACGRCGIGSDSAAATIQPSLSCLLLLPLLADSCIWLLLPTGAGCASWRCCICCCPRLACQGSCMMHRHQPAPQSPVKLPGRLPPEGQQAWVLALHLLALPTAHRPHPQHTAQCGLPPLLIPLLLPPVVPDAQHQMPVDAACSRCAARRLPQPPPHPCLPQSSRAAPGPPAGGVAPPCGAQRGAMRRRGGPRRSGPLCCTPPGQRGSPAAPACGQHGQAYSTAQRHLAGQSWCRARSHHSQAQGAIQQCCSVRAAGAGTSDGHAPGLHLCHPTAHLMVLGFAG